MTTKSNGRVGREQEREELRHTICAGVSTVGTLSNMCSGCSSTGLSARTSQTTLIKKSDALELRIWNLYTYQPVSLKKGNRKGRYLLVS